MRKRRGVFWIASAIGLLLVAIAAVGLSVWWGRFLRSDAFRNLISAKTGEALGAAVVYGPLRWTGSSIFSDSVQASGLPGRVIENLRADQVRADINWRAIFHGAWRVESIQAVSLGNVSSWLNAPAAGPVPRATASRDRLVASDAFRSRAGGCRASSPAFPKRRGD
jgi:hypothetical protein